RTATGSFLEGSKDVRHDSICAALRLERPAHLVIRVGLRSRQLIERLVHEENRAVTPPAEIKVVEHTRGAWVPTAEFEGVPGNAVFLDRHSCDQWRHLRHP